MNVIQPGGRRRGRRTVRWLLASLAVLAAVGILALVWFSEELAWSMARPGDARLLENTTLRPELPPDVTDSDISYLRAELPRRIPQFAGTVDQQAFGAEVEALSAPIRGGGRDTGILALMRMAALPGAEGIGTGHTRIQPLQRPVNWGFYPYLTYLFDDGLWVVAGKGDGEGLIGWEILEIGGRSVPEVLAAARPFAAADNDSGRRDEVTALLSYAGFLRGLSLTGDDGVVRLVVRSRAGERRDVAVAPVRLASLSGLAWGRAMQEQVEGWSPADPRPRRHAYMLDYRADARLLYVQVNRIASADGESWGAFAQRLVDVATHEPVEKVVLDLRANGGGNNQLVDELVKRISGHPVIDRHGVLYTLIGRRTYSAAGALAAALELRTKTRFAGETSGFAPNHHGDAATIRLPASNILVRVATRYWEDGGPYDRRAAIEPDLRVPFESAHHFNGEDPVLAAVGADAAPSEAPALAPEARDAAVGRIAGWYRFSPHLIMEIEGGWLTVRGTEIRARSELYPVDEEGTQFATDIAGVSLEREPSGHALALDWRGVTHVLTRLPTGFRLPIERVEAGVEQPAELQAGIAELRRSASDGASVDSRVEFALNRVGYALLRAGRTPEAVATFELQTGLFPTVANGFDSLGEAYLAAGDQAKAAAAFRRALEINPSFDHPRRMLDEIGATTPSADEIRTTAQPSHRMQGLKATLVKEYAIDGARLHPVGRSIALVGQGVLMFRTP